MARLPRYYIKDQPQHIIQRGNNREPIFAANEDYLFYLECLQEAAKRHDLSIHAYVLMTNHVHILASPQATDSIPKTLQSVGRRYVQYFNHSYKRTGTLWEGRYKATVIDSDRYLLTCMRYIELNPVRAGMVEHPHDYIWSSYAANAEGKRDVKLTHHSLYQQLGIDETERISTYQQLFQSAITDIEQDTIRESTNKGWCLGNDLFRDKIECLSKRRATPKAKGRPRKA
ncbi:MAG: transposase [Piscirickettsiaceae bacterium]|nr:MAG: transposase [Piscirickettsiaceae bacterium]